MIKNTFFILIFLFSALTTYSQLNFGESVQIDDGKAVFMSDDEITCTSNGAVKLLGMEAGNSADMGDYTDNRQRVFQGKMMVYVQSLGKKGTAKVTFESPWLKKAEVILIMN
jgi:beta-galactosidase